MHKTQKTYRRQEAMLWLHIISSYPVLTNSHHLEAWLRPSPTQESPGSWFCLREFPSCHFDKPASECQKALLFFWHKKQRCWFWLLSFPTFILSEECVSILVITFGSHIKIKTLQTQVYRQDTHLPYEPITVQENISGTQSLVSWTNQKHSLFHVCFMRRGELHLSAAVSSCPAKKN